MPRRSLYHRHGDRDGESRVISLIIAGSRTVRPTLADIDAAMDDMLFVKADVTEVVCGGAKGADASGREWAIRNKIPVHMDVITDADMTHGVYLGPRMRNRRMAERGTMLLAFWDGISGGTADMVCRMIARNKPTRVIPMRKFQREPSKPRGEKRPL